MTPRAGPGSPIAERKQKPDGSIREYACTLAYASAPLVIVRFEMPEGSAGFDTPRTMPPGSWSFGFFWLRRPFNLYRMRRPDGAVALHRFDALTAMRFSAAAIAYRDLAIDWWVLDDDTLIEEDRAEFDRLVAAGIFSRDDVAAAHAASRTIHSRYRHIIEQAARLEQRLHLV